MMKDLNMYLKVAIEQVESCNISVPTIYTITTMKSCRIWGQCSKGRDGYIIRINEALLRDDVSDISLMNTLVHEVLHSCPGGFSHGEVWKRYASLLNKKFGYNIKRCNEAEEKGLEDKLNYKYSVTCDKCGAVSYYNRKGKIIKLIERKPKHSCCRCRCGGTSFTVRDLTL